MADCVSLLDEELSSFVFNYLTENSASQYGEEEVCSDRMDTDFPDFDLSQLDTSDFDSVNCLSELQWCNDHSCNSPASIRYSAVDAELFETEEENAALLAALTDSLDGIAEDEAGGLSVFPSLGEDPDEEEEEDEEDGLPLDSEPFPGSLSPEAEDPSLLKKLLLSPPNVPVALDSHRGSSSLRRSLHQKPARLLPKCDRMCLAERKPRAVRPAGRLCIELHRHLTTTQQPDAEEEPSADTEEEDEEEEDEEEDSDSEEEEEEEESSSSSEVESSASAEPAEPQFASEKERHSVVELIRYMHTYCLPMRKQASWDRKEREAAVRRGRTDTAPAPRGPPNSCSRPSPQSNAPAPNRPRVPFARQREIRAHSLLRELLEAVTAFDVSKPYRLHSPPYGPEHGPSAHRPRAEPKDSGSDGTQVAAKRPKGPEPERGSFSVRRSRRLASFPSHFAKRLRLCSSGLSSEEEGGLVKDLPADPPSDDSSLKGTPQKSPKGPEPCCNNEKRACLCLPLTPKSTGDTQYGSRPFEQTLCVELCGTAGLTPPTTPPHKPVEEEPFKPEGKAEPPGRGACPARVHARKLPEQTELYAQLRRTGHAGNGQAKRAYGDHDYCLLSLGENRKRSAAGLPSPSRPADTRETEEGSGERSGPEVRQEEAGSRRGQPEVPGADSPPAPPLGDPEETGQPSPAYSPSPEADIESPESCQPPSPCHQIALSCESSEMRHQDKSKNRTKDDVDKCQVFYIHNLPSSVTQAMLRRRFQALGRPEDCQVLVKDEERCGVITLRQTSSELNGRPRRDSAGQHAGSGTRRLGRKRYIDLDEAGPGPVKSKYDALDFDTLLKEAQRSLHR
ncbi:peroxisome proliferator-activated receptor gamma coactivator 1-beta isoform X1 [Electrophorus electricus]|uniref:peroxisome proliferator-activated receptor gamma coactivator 1-beta isoform X1 n=2 Tax=Electrophorus electricus TaxID=8005 RepID=UPI0015D070A4|nr:peroxisome proliferator-activated receptor gamma coactivator 1-beta isoform X1 [Electrophorus electricus]